MNHKKYTLNENTTKLLTSLLEKYEVNLSAPKRISESIINLSNNYKNELTDHSNIWGNSNYLKAYLVYFLPLNIIRLSSVLCEIKNFLDIKSLSSVYDYGSGPGTGHLALKNTGLEPKALFNFDKSKQALKIHESWAKQHNINFTSSLSDWDNINSNSLGIFSYAFNELENFPSQIVKHDHLLVLEPSNQLPARRLQKYRGEFSKLGYNVVAPCTHQNECPLLKHSKKDWCHNRIFTELPHWFNSIEKLIPMKNSNITYSYLFVSKTIRPQSNPLVGRVIGDTLKEKGKTRQAFCRGKEREFLSWLKKDGKPKEIPRGSLYELNPNHEKKGNELRGLTK